MPGGGTVRLRARNQTLEGKAAGQHSGAKAGPYVALEIHDSGAEIPPSIQEKLFEPFADANDARQRSGLGLSLVLGIVRSHGGFIDVNSHNETGTTFEILLPAAAETPLSSSDHAAERPSRPGELILVVEDEAGLREITRRTLSRQGYQVLAAADGQEALGLLARHQGQVRVVLTNMATPSMDGPALAHAARQIDPAVRIIVSSSLGRSLGQNDRLSALHSVGINRVLAQPYTADELIEAIGDELNHVARAGRGNLKTEFKRG
jgi:CheY-like chemotaxis protein